MGDDANAGLVTTAGLLTQLPPTLELLPSMRNKWPTIPSKFPSRFCDVTEQNVRQARMAYGQFMDAMTQAMGMWFGAMPANAMTSGFKAVQDLATQYAKANAEAAFTLANNIAKARDMQEIISLQSSFGQSQMQAYATQAQEIGKMMAAAAQNAGRG